MRRLLAAVSLLGVLALAGCTEGKPCKAEGDMRYEGGGDIYKCVNDPYSGLVWHQQ